MEKLGKQTIKFNAPPTILDCASIVGPKEAEGPLAKYFDQTLDDEFWGEKTWEKAESKIIKETVNTVISKSGVPVNEIDCMFAGDLLNQCTGSHYAMKNTDLPFFGLYGACSTMAQSSALAAMAVDGGYADNAIAITSSHFCSSEKQYRFPLEYGGQRPPTAQWTVTGSGAIVVSKEGNGPYITHVTTGKIIDMGINDANNMGAAMAPAAVDTIVTHFEDTGFTPDDYDLIVTGDLASVGADITCELGCASGYDISKIYNDCGKMVFDTNTQDVHAGGSGCGAEDWGAVYSRSGAGRAAEGRAIPFS